MLGEEAVGEVDAPEAEVRQQLQVVDVDFLNRFLAVLVLHD